MNHAAGKELPGRPGLADLVIALGLLIFLAWTGWGAKLALSSQVSAGGLAVMVILPLILSAVTLYAFRLPREYRISTALCLCSAIAALYMAEGYIELGQKADRFNRPGFDPRKKIEVIADLRRQGVEAYPVMRAKTLLLPAADGQLRSVLGDDDFLPLASLPRRRVVSCNESGAWLAYDSDRHGFNNQDGTWDGGRPDIVMLGDSFAHGSCVPPDGNIAAWLNARRGKTINLGVSGFGPLSMLAALAEYAEPLRPAHVLWFFFEGNDLNDDLPFERGAPLLRSYLEKPGFRQGLPERHAELETRLKAYLDEKLVEAMGRFDNPHEKLMDFLQLFHFRERFGLGPLSLALSSPADIEEQGKYFARVLEAANRRVEKWGGRLWLVYLPESARYFAAEQNGELRRRIHRAALDAANKMEIPVIDIAADFADTPRPGDFFEYPGSHYNQAGYRRVGEAVAAAMDREAPR